MSEKLTKSQNDLLHDLLHNGPQVIHPSYRPAADLVEKGLASIRKYIFGNFDELTITDAGRAHPAATQGDAL